MAQPSDTAIPALVRRLQDSSMVEQALAANGLLQVYDSGANRQRTIAAAIAEAGGIPALVQLVSSQSDGDGGLLAASLLARVSADSPTRCQAIIAAGGIAALVRCLESSSLEDMQAAAAGTLGSIASDGGVGEAGRAAVAAAAVPAAIRRLSSSSNDSVLRRTACLLCALADSPERRHAIAAAGGIPPLVRLLRHSSHPLRSRAAAALSCFVPAPGSEARIRALEAAGGIPPLVELLASSSDSHTAAALFFMLESGHSSIAAKIIQAGGILALLCCVGDQQATDQAHTLAIGCIRCLAYAGEQPSQAIAEAGGIRALLHGALARPDSPVSQSCTARALLELVLRGQAAAVAAADPTHAVPPMLGSLLSLPMLGSLLSLPEYASIPEAHADVAEALRLLAAARRSVPAGSTAQPPASSAAAANQPPARPPRVCAAPGCGAIAGLRRCAGCGSVRYCSEACMRAHWKEHRPECKRLRAAAAGEAGPSRPRLD